jgi:cytochrome c biogenesis protein CcmG/thiol:disulfide interchange protein DsbE
VKRWLVAALLLLVVAGCAASKSTVQPGSTFSPNPKHSELVLRAALDACPSSTGSPTSGGLPDVTLPCLGAGPVVHLASLRGKPTVVNIWGSWCGPCQKESAYLSSTYDTLKSKVRFLGVDTVDDPDSALDFAVHVTPRMRYPSVVDSNKQVLLGVGGSLGPPITVFVDARGRIVHKSFGPYLSGASLRADIARYLGVSA